MPLSWSDLPSVVTRERATESRNERGANIIDWAAVPAQSIQCTIQPYVGRTGRGADDQSPEGILQKTTHLMYCNYVTAKGSRVPTDIKFLDRIKDAKGTLYRVVYPLDEAGVGDHIKALLSTITPSGE